MVWLNFDLSYKEFYEMVLKNKEAPIVGLLDLEINCNQFCKIKTIKKSVFHLLSLMSKFIKTYVKYSLVFNIFNLFPLV